MGFMDKLKNIFTEEVEETTPIKKEVLQVEIPAPVREVKEEKVEIKPEKKPTLFFDDEDFEILEEKKEEKVEIKPAFNPSYEPKPLYGGHSPVKKETKSVDEKKDFKPSPIISPIYGMLDKNYVKEDIVEKKVVDVLTEDTNLDSIRNKAFGTLEDDLEDTLFGKTSILLNDETDVFEEKEDLFKEEDILETFDALEHFEEPKVEIIEETKEEKILTRFKENDIPVKKYKEKREIEIELVEEVKDLDIFDEIDSKPVQEETPKRPKDLVDESDLFDLIDSMYERKDEE